MNIEMHGICKAFGANVVLREVPFSLKGGEICALLGENGAGKSTLMNILGGVLPADAGEMLLDGAPVVFHNPAESMHAGIGFIHQELNLINDLAIYENMFIGREVVMKNGLLDAQRMIRETQAVFDRMDLELNPKTMVRDLDASYKQIVEICRALMMNASIIIMDEPTSSLTGPEIERVFEMMRALKDQGVGIVFISHKLKEVMQICDRYTILRDGKMVAEGAVAQVSTDDLARFMVGHDIRTMALQRKRDTAQEVLRAEALTDHKNFRDISFSVRAGEVLGITGLLGDGRSELFQAIIGAGSDYSGQIYFQGKPIKVKNTTQAVDLGIGYLPRNRKENGIIKDMTILENGPIVPWPRLARFGLLNSFL
ncbi:MAG: sugar ABC transporter ATP-binding protein, partial [Rhodocyclaceae bacterium]|nr:sugar ABC transporter ATP-binding protein [Rhodocyclaceae bacterium]